MESQLVRKEGVILGRNSTMSHVVLRNDKSISRKHAIISAQNEDGVELNIKDQSKYGIRINGEKGRNRIKDRDCIQFGIQENQYQCKRHTLRIGQINEKTKDIKGLININKEIGEYDVIINPGDDKEIKCEAWKPTKDKVKWNLIDFIQAIEDEKQPEKEIVQPEYLSLAHDRYHSIQDYQTPMPNPSDYRSIIPKKVNIRKAFRGKHFQVEHQDEEKLKRWIENQGGVIISESKSKKTDQVILINSVQSILEIILEQRYEIAMRKRGREETKAIESTTSSQLKTMKRFKSTQQDGSENSNKLFAVSVEYVDEHLSDDERAWNYNAKVFRKKNNNAAASIIEIE